MIIDLNDIFYCAPENNECTKKENPQRIAREALDRRPWPWPTILNWPFARWAEIILYFLSSASPEHSESLISWPVDCSAPLSAVIWPRHPDDISRLKVVMSLRDEI